MSRHDIRGSLNLVHGLAPSVMLDWGWPFSFPSLSLSLSDFTLPFFLTHYNFLSTTLIHSYSFHICFPFTVSLSPSAFLHYKPSFLSSLLWSCPQTQHPPTLLLHLLFLLSKISTKSHPLSLTLYFSYQNKIFVCHSLPVSLLNIPPLSLFSVQLWPHLLPISVPLHLLLHLDSAVGYVCCSASGIFCSLSLLSVQNEVWNLLLLWVEDSGL